MTFISLIFKLYIIQHMLNCTHLNNRFQIHTTRFVMEDKEVEFLQKRIVMEPREQTINVPKQVVETATRTVSIPKFIMEPKEETFQVTRVVMENHEQTMQVARQEVQTATRTIHVPRTITEMRTFEPRAIVVNRTQLVPRVEMVPQTIFDKKVVQETRYVFDSTISGDNGRLAHEPYAGLPTHVPGKTISSVLASTSGAAAQAPVPTSEADSSRWPSTPGYPPRPEGF
jgi:hypothetical protein